MTTAVDLQTTLQHGEDTRGLETLWYIVENTPGYSIVWTVVRSLSVILSIPDQTRPDQTRKPNLAGT